MITTIIAWISSPFQSLFCKHDYYKKTWRTQENGFYRYSERLYCCEKCGREKWVHGDYDTINALTKEEKEFLAEMEERRMKSEAA